MLSNFLRNRRKQKLLEEIESDPNPSQETFISLVGMLREDNDLQGASRIAKRGAELYPESADILDSRDEMDRVIRELDKERLRQKIESYPNPILYARLAELYRVDNQVEAAMHVCREGISSFPSYGGTYLVLGEIHQEGGDLAGARMHYEKAVELDRYNYMALKQLAEVYMALGMPTEATARLEEVLSFSPGDDIILAMLEEAGRELHADEPAAEFVNEDEVPVAVMETVEAEPNAPQQNDAYQEAPPAEPIAADSEYTEPGYDSEYDAPESGVVVASEEELNASISNIAKLNGVSGALLVDSYGLVVASDLSDELDEELAGALITNIYRSVSRSAEPIGIGSFEEGVIEGENGNIHVIGMDDLILAVFASSDVKIGMLEKTIRDFVEGALG